MGFRRLGYSKGPALTRRLIHESTIPGESPQSLSHSSIPSSATVLSEVVILTHSAVLQVEGDGHHLLSDSLVEEFWRNGFIANVPVLTSDQCDQLLRDYQELQVSVMQTINQFSL